MTEDKISRREMMSKISIAAAGTVVGCSSVSELGAAPVTFPSSTFNVRDFGAKGDGKSNDTVAIQNAVKATIKNRGGSVYIPAGKYRVTRSISFTSSDMIDIVGDGTSSTIMHENDEPVFLWKEGVSFRESSIRNISIKSVKKPKSPNTPTIACLGGTERSYFGFVSIFGMGSGIVTENVMDTTTIDQCLMWRVAGTGVRVARGSEVRIFGARIVGATNPYDSIGSGSIGVHLVGNNGGVHIVTTDIISFNTGLKIGSEGGPSNREVFITHATFDSSIHGIWQIDGAYTSIAGCWAASSDEDQILLDSTANGAILSVSGGTIFNGGAYGREASHNGIVVRAGSFMLTGVMIRNNKGTGILVDNDRVNAYSITGCKIQSNGTGAVLNGDGFAVTGNVFAGNGVNLIDNGGKNKKITGNVIP